MYQRKRAASAHTRRRRSSLPPAFAALVCLAAALLALGSASQPDPAQVPEHQSGAAASSAPSPEPSPAPSPEPSQTPDRNSWKLTLVNRWNPLPESWHAYLLQLSNGLYVDERCYPDLQDMMDDCRAAGLSPKICSAYRTRETQERLYQNEVSAQMALGLSQERAREEAGKAVALPGTSEHQLGLALDIVDVNDQHLDRSQEDTPVQRWLMAHSWEYGFILRYSGGKSDITGIIYEPWHYRYVGKEAAREIYESGLCLEEYLER